ncbi:MAG: hypothetical protein CMJ80_17730 [Planctomycetaceae bacterium]|nr:hypothetical protein [Planctomycetaceae bacterium]
MAPDTLNRPLRVGWYIHPLRLGGLEHFLLRLAKKLDPQHVEIVGIFARKGEVVDAFTGCGIETKILNFRSFRHGFENLSESLLSHRIDLVQTNMFTPLAAIAAEHVGLPHIWRVGGHPDVALRRMNPDERRMHLEVMAAQSTAIVCNSQFVAEPFAGFSGPKPVIIRNGVANVLEYQVRAPSKKHLRNLPRICMLAHFDPQKRHEDLIRAAALVITRFPQARFALYGSTFGETSMVAYRKELRKLIISLGLEGVVIMKRTKDAVAELCRATVSVMPSINESSSNAILESMACGTPVIAADSGGNKEMIDSSTNGLLVTQCAPEELANAILNLLQEPAFAQKIAISASQKIRHDYDLDICATRYLTLYRSCMNDLKTVDPENSKCAV